MVVFFWVVLILLVELFFRMDSWYNKYNYKLLIIIFIIAFKMSGLT